MGPIKINIKTDTSEYGGGPDTQVNENVLNKAEEDSNKENDIVTSETKDVKEDSKKESEENSCYEYEGDDCFYTEKSSGVRYKWSNDENSWVNAKTGEKQGSTASVGASVSDIQKNYKMEGGTYVYVDRLTNKKHKWNLETNEWDVVENDEASEDDESEEDENMSEEERKARQYRKRKAAPGWDQANYTKDPDTGVTTYKDPNDGMVYEYDETKKAWFPKIDNDFMAVYQLNYGFTSDGTPEPTKPAEEEPKKEPEPEPQMKKPKVKEKPKEAEWFQEEDAKSTKVYVSNLPLDISEEEFIEYMSKCGMVEFDARSKKPKVKLYKDKESNQLKGDGLCSYIKHESVELALTILDGSDFKGKVISVERAKFELKGEYDPKLKPKKLSKKQLEKAKKQKERLFAWVPDKMRGERGKHEKVVVIKNMFDVKAVDEDPGLILDYSNNIRKQCSKFGTVSKVILYDKHPEGVCQIFFKDPSEADMAVQMLNGRMFIKNVMAVETWDGRSKYNINESSAEEKERLAQWEKFLEDGDEDKKEDKE